MKPIIDISFYQNPSLIDYDLIAANVSGVILRAAYGIWKDTAFDRHYQELAQIRGVPVGAYHYIIGSVGIQEQADAFNLAVGLKDMRLGCWIDVEDRRAGTRIYRQQVLDYAALQPDMGVYTSKSAWAEIMGGAYLTDRKLWVAHYTANPYPLLPQGWDSWRLWQYTSSGRLPGYTGNLDCNRFNGDDADFAAWVGETEAPDPVEKLFDAKVVTTPPNRLRTRYTPNGNVRPESDWLQSQAIVPVYETHSTGWWRVAPEAWSSTSWLARVGDEPLPITEKYYGALYWQRDPRWKDILLGYSKTMTIGGWGCLIVTLAMRLGLMPDVVNDRLKAVGGFTGANVYWQMVQVAFPELTDFEYIECYWTPAPLDRIDSRLAEGIPVHVHVDLYNETASMEQHWVLIVGKNGDDYIINDPWTGRQGSFREVYGDPARWIFRIASWRKL